MSSSTALELQEENSTEFSGAFEFERVFGEYSAYVAAIAAKILGRDDEVEDVVQEVFLEVHRGISKLRDPKALKGWLAKITVRVASRKLKRRKLKRLLGFDSTSPDFEAIADNRATPEHRAEVSALYRRLERVPVAERVAWVLRHVQGESMESVAQLCNCSLSTARRRVDAAQAWVGDRS